MEKKMENEMETGIIRGIMGIRVSQNWGTILKVPIIRTRIFLGSILGFPCFGKLPCDAELGVLGRRAQLLERLHYT